MKMMNHLRPQRCNKCDHKLWVYARKTDGVEQGYLVIACPQCGIAALNKDAGVSV